MEEDKVRMTFSSEMQSDDAHRCDMTKVLLQIGLRLIFLEIKGVYVKIQVQPK